MTKINATFKTTDGFPQEEKIEEFEGVVPQRRYIIKKARGLKPTAEETAAYNRTCRG